MIPTVLIENALKHSVPNSPIEIEFSSEKSFCVVRVSNTCILSRPLTNNVFEKGVRMTEIEGSGNGLYLARLVAEQHDANLSVSTENLGGGAMECTFAFCIPEFVGTHR